MSIDPLALIQAQRSTTPNMGDSGVPLRGLRMPDGQLKIIAHGPGDPGYADRIPPPDDLKTQEPDPVDADLEAILSEMKAMDETAPKSTATLRIAVGFGRQEGTFAVVVEQAPDWDSVAAKVVSGGALMEMLPILRAFGKIKDNTGELAALEEEYREESARSRAAPAARPRVSNARKGQPEAEGAGPNGDGPTA